MLNRRGRGALLLALAFTLAAGAGARAQDSDASRQAAPPRPDVNHEILIQLLTTAESGEAGARVPQSLEGVVRQLKSSLPPSDYRLAAAFINRVRDGAGFDVTTAGGGMLASAQTPAQPLPATFRIALGVVKLIDPASAQPSVSLQNFRFGMKVAVQMTNVQSDRGGGTYPVLQYEDLGLGTQCSVREGEPTLVGTLNSGRPGQFFVIVVTARRTGR